ncbi:nucleotide pyrophosphohydrolase [Bacillus cereus]|uniref:nucleotide pyrophosphohydrolase n=1 Tax=Bacillus cereus TaxID=1396 RepID=UPI00240543AA|nr:nucleotide pyrophosphohydrolase [Bacillus cereus]MDF9540371.1 nucleotide pyrophosphohydrolase [Bacillus cereus]MDF9583494.1 nucleotide pyrophosphohydrolase [Bacillus cereus]MDF9583562.1 nucleotide pyrophosphohydrolase [Bacillus cereus]MDG1590313.1 nucleotide pyrophosphohydrolase [Bacillus cereus]
MNQNTIKEILKFRDDRDWKQFHNSKDLAISLSLEASELLENFQWKSSEDAIEQNLENIKDELADVLIYSILLADQMNLDIEEVIQNKLEKNKRKYPVKKSFGSNKKYNEL